MKLFNRAKSRVGARNASDDASERPRRARGRAGARGRDGGGFADDGGVVDDDYFSDDSGLLRGRDANDEDDFARFDEHGFDNDEVLAMV